MQITDSLFLACCKCPYKAFLKSKGEAGKILEYEAIQTEADAQFREQAVERLVATHAGGIVLRDPPSLTAAVEGGIDVGGHSFSSSPRDGRRPLGYALIPN